MALLNLPNELLDLIVEFSLPEGFENFAMTCKKIHAQCTPFMKRHNDLHSQFRHFQYWKDDFVAASDLIDLIATDPSVARYIRKADFRIDSRFIEHRRASGHSSKPLPSIEDGGPVVQLFAESTHLQRAGLDWREFYSAFAEDVRMERYSQHGSAFLLTLLVNAVDLALPCSWDPNAATKQLLDLHVDDAKQSSLSSSSLRSVTDLRWDNPRGVGLSWASYLIALPHLKTFGAPFSFAVGEIPDSLAFRGSPSMAERLSEAYLYNCWIDDVGITDLLKHTPSLTKLHYSHAVNYDRLPLEWDMCKFINSIAREAGSHLIELSVRILDLDTVILPGKASACFQKLAKFQFPLDYVMGNVDTVGATGNTATPFLRFFDYSVDPFIHGLLPESLTHLALLRLNPTPGHDKALGTLFRHFRALRKYQLRNLRELHVARGMIKDETYSQQCDKIATEAGRAGVDVYLEHGNHCRTPGWRK
ncbi:hypothetical protein DM02DRAFT_701475 [Periconia macrospinosa]|uniref:F-box domain-containing protein n=1 Tax=Periconia macrospinosa TaxID=97972 RepID=A0A2V1D271_9PLEO|nr:hypothetical protein DM02DRAFT_701475 [Periconia macrospinosa]